MTPYRAGKDLDCTGVLALIREAFAYMDGVIDPPSSLHRLTAEEVAHKAALGQVWAIGTPPRACLFLTPKADALYIGKLAVAGDQRGKGLARALISAAEDEARRLGLSWLELETRIELTANHDIFRALGFHETARSRHPGFDRDTSLTFRSKIDPP